MSRGPKPTNPTINRSHPLAQGLVGAWLFDEGGGDVLRDVSGRGNDGTLQNAPTRTNEQYGGGLDFNGSTHWVEVPSAPMYVGLQDVSVVWHQNTDDTSSAYLILDQRNFGSPYTGFCFNPGQVNSVFHLEFNSVTTRWIVSSPSMPNSVSGFHSSGWNWYALTCVRSGNANLYRNGVLIASWSIAAASAANVTGSLPFKIAGHHQNSSSWVYDGQMDYMAMWHRALSANEVLATYASPWDLYRGTPIRERYRGKSLVTIGSPQTNKITLTRTLFT